MANKDGLRGILRRGLGFKDAQPAVDISAFITEASRVPSDKKLYERATQVQDNIQTAMRYLESPEISESDKERLNGLIPGLMVVYNTLVSDDGKILKKDGESLIALEAKVEEGPPAEVKQSQESLVDWFSDHLKVVEKRILTTPDTKPELIARLSVVRDTLAEQHEKANRIYQTILTEISHQTNKMKVEENPGYKNIAISSIRERWKELNALNMDLLDGTLEDNIAAVRTVQKDVTHLLLSEHLQEPLTSEDRVFLSVAQTDLSNLLGPLMRKKYGEVQGSSDEESDAPSFKERHQGRLDAGDDTEEPGDPYQKL